MHQSHLDRVGCRVGLGGEGRRIRCLFRKVVGLAETIAGVVFVGLVVRLSFVGSLRLEEVCLDHCCEVRKEVRLRSQDLHQVRVDDGGVEVLEEEGVKECG